MDNLYESASEDEFDGEEYEYDPEIILDSMDKSKTINFSIRANYTKWAPREAFRELVQHWHVDLSQPTPLLLSRCPAMSV